MRSRQAIGIPAEKFLARANEGTFDSSLHLPEDADASRGSCSPRPTRFPKQATADEVIQRLLDEFTERTSGLPWDRTPRTSASRRTRS